MFEYIKGTLVESSPVRAIVETQGLAYRIWIPLSHYAKLPQTGQEITLFLRHVVREDSEDLYGFLSRSDRELFELLIAISGIGPKTALGLIGHMEGSAFQQAISESDIPALCRIPGVGKKTAERLIIELRDKIKKLVTSTAPVSSLAEDALSALIHLGYSNAHAQKAIKTALDKNKENPSLSQLITLALRCL